jgi:Integrase core domain
VLPSQGAGCGGVFGPPRLAWPGCGAQKLNPGGVNKGEVGLSVRFDSFAMDTLNGRFPVFPRQACRYNLFGMLRLQISVFTRLSAVSELFGGLLRFVSTGVCSQSSLIAEEHPGADCAHGEQRCWFLIHDRDSIFSAEFDRELAQGFGLTVLRTPPQLPQANAHCERLVGTVRRECLDFLIPLTERHLRRLLGEWVRHYNGGRPHRSLGPGIPDHGLGPAIMTVGNRNTIPEASQFSARSVRGGLHHEYSWDRIAA